MPTEHTIREYQELEDKLCEASIKIENLLIDKKLLREACEHFVNKVEIGLAQSKDSYKRFKDVLELTK